MDLLPVAVDLLDYDTENVKKVLWIIESYILLDPQATIQVTRCEWYEHLTPTEYNIPPQELCLVFVHAFRIVYLQLKSWGCIKYITHHWHDLPISYFVYLRWRTDSIWPTEQHLGCLSAGTGKKGFYQVISPLTDRRWFHPIALRICIHVLHVSLCSPCYPGRQHRSQLYSICWCTIQTRQPRLYGWNHG